MISVALRAAINNGENKIIGRKLEKKTQDLRGSTNCLRPREREQLLLLSLFHRVTIVDYLY